MAEKTMVVSYAKVLAAQVILRIDAQRGRESRAAAIAIANAKPRVRKVKGNRRKVDYVVTIP